MNPKITELIGRIRELEEEIETAVERRREVGRQREPAGKISGQDG
jgi:hypothetical protein